MLQRKFGKRGLSIVGVTDGEAEKTRPWIERLGARHAWAVNDDLFAFRNGLRVYPRAMLVDPDGIVVWTGHPTDLDEETLDKALAGALDVPLWKWPAAVSEVSSALSSGRWGAALVAADRLVRGDETLAPWKARATALVEGVLDGVETSFRNGDVLGAWERSYWYEAELRGTALEGRVGEIVAAIRAAPTTASMYERQSSLRELLGRSVADVAEAKALIAEMTKVSEADPKSIVAQDARNGVRYWEAMMASGHLKAKDEPSEPAGEGQ